MRVVGIAITSAAVAAIVACKNSTGPAASRNSPGTGTSTLLVTATIDANDKALSTGFQTSFDVSLRTAAGAPVTGATVTFTNATYGSVTPVENPANSGDYTVTRDGFPGGDFQLDVVKGSDNVRGVVLGGPSTHSITAPAQNATVPANQPLTVRWTVTKSTQALGAEVETKVLTPPASVPDTGAYVIAAASNPPDAAQRIIVYRYNEVSIAGGLTGSYLRVRVRNTVDPVRVQ